MRYAIHWFRRDLRIQDNPALTQAIDEFDGKVLGLFCFDARFLARPDFSHARFGFFLKTLRLLKQDLESRGGELLVVDKQPKEIFEWLIAKKAPEKVFWNRDYEPFARERDKSIAELLKQHGIAVETERDHLVIEPEEFLEGLNRGPYQVFTPFQKRWMDLIRHPTFGHRIAPLKTGKLSLKWKEVFKEIHPDACDLFEQKNTPHVSVSLPEAGPETAKKKIKKFSEKLSQYSKDRDIPSLAGTSQLSIFLKNGSLTVAQVIYALDLLKSKSLSTQKFLSELIWREFYYHILYHFPQVEKESFLTQFKNIHWQNNPKWFEAWKKGETGYPIVDAGMRQLNTTGWMHNRVRMIVASFLTKDLLIDWRWGEKYFMEKLLDGDLAPNNGGWQWAASTGCDPQPYFRIFNPYLQSEKFDPEGDYIRRFVPELKSVDSKKIHQPEGISGYPAPMVVHSEQRQAALKLYSVK